MIEFRILSEISNVETIAAGEGVTIRRQLERHYGKVDGVNERVSQL